MKILGVDDEEGALKLLTNCLNQCCPDDEKHFFLNALEAITFAETYIPDIAFLDIQMPAISGIEMAKMLKRINSKINIIFVTGFTDYTIEAFSLRVSGYLMKPVMVSDIKRELDNLRIPINDINENRIVAQTFGRFEIFVEGKPVVFGRKPAKELLAYLIDLHGASADRKTIAAVLFEDAPYNHSLQTYISLIVKDMMTSLEKVHAEEIIVRSNDSYAVNVKSFQCDSYDYLNGMPYAINKFYGEYMSQYAWSEDSIGKFYKDF